MRLSAATLCAVPESVRRFDYDRDGQMCGIVHFGIGAFHRAHQALYTDDAMAAGDRHWGITGVSLRSSDVFEQLDPQDGLYTVTERSGDHMATRVIGSVRKVIVAPHEPEAVIAAIASHDTHIASFTITEKGYQRRADGALDITAAGVADDLAGRGAPKTIYGFLAQGLRRRRIAGLPGMTLMSCDNLSGNGASLSRLLTAYLDRTDPATAQWFQMECACPSSMVDRIVPATTAADLDGVAARLGMRDAAAAITEPFMQWVIEDRFAGPRPRWEVGGAQFVKDVRPYEIAKLRMLNGAHSALAYLGLARGHAHVHEAIADPELFPLVERLMRQEAAASIDAAQGQDLATYADALLSRFANPALPHRLMQIAMDGSQKIPQRWLEPMTINHAAGRDSPATRAALDAWVLHIRGDSRVVEDPMARDLASLWQRHGEKGIMGALFGQTGPFARWRAGFLAR